ncbi:MAG: Cys-tRNA(Pro) deacylase [Geminicoccaceae bacterium]
MPKKSAGSSGATPAVSDVERRGLHYRLHRYDFDPGDLGIGEQAAEALGIAAERLFKTLMVVIDGQKLAVALTPVNAETHMKTLAAAVGGKRVAMATIDQAERVTGYVKGGISPFGQRQQLDVVVDRSIELHETIFVNGGKRGLQIELAPADLIAALKATLADLAR